MNLTASASAVGHYRGSSEAKALRGQPNTPYVMVAGAPFRLLSLSRVIEGEYRHF
jgi:hypothetical protein